MSSETVSTGEEKAGMKTARWIAVAGLIAMAFAAAVLGCDWARRHFVSPREKARRISCASSLKSLGLALRMYSSDWNEHFPPGDGAAGLELLRSQGYCENHKMYLCPSANAVGKDEVMLTEGTVGYNYFGGYKESDAPNLIVMCDKDGNHIDYGNVLFLDGSVRCYDGKSLAVFSFDKQRGIMTPITGASGKHWSEVLAEGKAQHEKVVGPRRRGAGK